MEHQVMPARHVIFQNMFNGYTEKDRRTYYKDNTWVEFTQCCLKRLENTNDFLPWPSQDPIMKIVTLWIWENSRRIKESKVEK